MNKSSHILPIAILIMVVAFAAGLARPAEAADFDDDGVIEAGETIDDDVFLTGDTVRVDGTVNGMLFATGRTLTINGTVNGDAILMGQTITVTEGAQITGNLFVGAGNISVDGRVGGSIAAGSATLDLGGPASVGRNVYYGGYGLATAQGSTIDRGVYVSAYQAVLDGAVGNDLYASIGALRLNGSITGDAVVDVAGPGNPPAFTNFMVGSQPVKFPQPIPPGIVIAEGAEIAGKLTYTSPVQQPQGIAAEPQGGVVYQTPEPTRGAQPAPASPGAAALEAVVRWLWSFLRTLFTLLLLGLAAAWLIPMALDRTVAAMRARPAESAGIGVLAFFGGYLGALIVAGFILVIGIVLTVITLGGLARTVFGVGFSGLALVMTVFTLLVSYGSKLVVAYLVGELILAGVAPNVTGRRYWAVVVGVIVYTLVRSIPFLGWLVGVVVTLFGLGAMWLAWRVWRRERVAVIPAAGD